MARRVPKTWTRPLYNLLELNSHSMGVVGDLWEMLPSRNGHHQADDELGVKTSRFTLHLRPALGFVQIPVGSFRASSYPPLLSSTMPTWYSFVCQIVNDICIAHNFPALKFTNEGMQSTPPHIHKKRIISQKILRCDAYDCAIMTVLQIR